MCGVCQMRGAIMLSLIFSCFFFCIKAKEVKNLFVNYRLKYLCIFHQQACRYEKK